MVLPLGRLGTSESLAIEVGETGDIVESAIRLSVFSFYAEAGYHPVGIKYQQPPVLYVKEQGIRTVCFDDVLSAGC